MKESTNHEPDPVTVIVRHRVIPGFEKPYEDWAQGISEAARRFDGSLAVNFIKPADLNKPIYTIIFKFNSQENMQHWEASPERREWAEKRRPFTIDEPEIEHHTGWDYWFTLPDRANKTPPRYKMALITWISIYPLALFIPMLLHPLIGWLPLAIEVLLTAAVIVPLMAWVVMPMMIKLFSGWLYPKE